MKYLLIIFFLLTTYIVNAQYVPNQGAYQYKGLKQTNSLQPPTGAAFPVTFTNAPDSNYAAWYYNTLDTSFYQFNPLIKTWTKLQSNGGLQVDSIFITSIDSIFINNNDSIFIITGNDTIFIGNANNGGDSIVSFEKNNTLDSIILLLRDGRRLAVKDEGGGSGASSITLDSFYVDFDTTIGYQTTAHISAATAKTIDISAESNDASGFVFGWNETEAVLTYQAGLKGIKKFYITYFR